MFVLFALACGLVAVSVGFAPSTAAAQAFTTTEKRLSTSLGSDYYPAISADTVVYTSDRNQDTDVYSYNLETGVEALVPPSSGRTGIYVIGSEGNGGPALLGVEWQMAPAWSPDGTKVAYSHGVKGICVANPDGSGEVQLTNGLTYASWPTWSPDGTKIAFQAYGTGGCEIRVMNADGSGQMLVTTGLYYVSGAPEWSPDGTKIAFQHQPSSGGCSIWVVSTDGSGLTQLTPSNGEHSGLDWSPDGTKIAYVSNDTALYANRGVFVVNTDGTGVTRLTTGHDGDGYPQWAPDGTKIVFTDGGICVVNADGSGRTQLTATGGNGYCTPQWSSDGTKIAFSNAGRELRVMNADGSGEVQLAAAPGEVYYPRWSPDGTKIMYWGHLSDGDEGPADVYGNTVALVDDWPNDIWLFDTAASIATKLGVSTVYTMDPAIGSRLVAWSDVRDGNVEVYARDRVTGEERRITDDSAHRDWRVAVSGNRIVWEKYNAGSYDIYMYDWSSGTTSQITSTPELEFRPDISGEWIVFERVVDGDRDVFAVNLATGVETRLVREGTQCNAHASGNFVSFDEGSVSADAAHVGIWDLRSGEAFQVTPTLAYSYDSDVDATGPNSGRVVYTDNRDNQSSDIYMTEFELTYPKAEVSPTEVLFGNVALGTSAPAIVTIQNTGAAPLTVTGAPFDPAATGVSITSAPTWPAVVAPGAYVEVNLAFAPTTVGAVSGTLKVETNDPANAVINVPLSGTGVSAEKPPEEQIAELLLFYKTSITDGTIYGIGSGKSAGNRAKALENMIEATGDLIRQGRYADAIQQLNDIYKKCDGADQPPDFVNGVNREELAEEVLALIEALGG